MLENVEEFEQKYGLTDKQKLTKKWIEERIV